MKCIQHYKGTPLKQYREALRLMKVISSIVWDHTPLSPTHPIRFASRPDLPSQSFGSATERTRIPRDTWNTTCTSGKPRSEDHDHVTDHLASTRSYVPETPIPHHTSFLGHFQFLLTRFGWTSSLSSSHLLLSMGNLCPFHTPISCPMLPLQLGLTQPKTLKFTTLDSTKLQCVINLNLISYSPIRVFISIDSINSIPTELNDKRK